MQFIIIICVTIVVEPSAHPRTGNFAKVYSIHYVKLWSTTRDDGRFIEISNSFIVLYYSIVDNNIDNISSDFLAKSCFQEKQQYS